MSRARGVRGARKMRSFVKDRVVAVANEEDFEAALRSGSERLLVIEFAASWSEPCKAMSQVMASLARSVEYSGVDFARVDLEACPSLGVKKAVLAAPTYHFYRAGVLLASFSGAMPSRIVELLDAHKGDAQVKKRGGSKLLGLLAVLALAGSCIALSNAHASQPAPPPAPPPAPVAVPSTAPEDDAARADDAAAAAPADGEPARELKPPKKQASLPSKGATFAQ